MGAARQQRAGFLQGQRKSPRLRATALREGRRVVGFLFARFPGAYVGRDLSGGNQGATADQPSERPTQTEGRSDLVRTHQRTATQPTQRTTVALRIGGRIAVPRLAAEGRTTR